MPIMAIVPTEKSNQIEVTLSEPFVVDGEFRLGESGIPSAVEPLLSVEGMEAIKITGPRMTLTRDPNLDWDSILEDLQKIV